MTPLNCVVPPLVAPLKPKLRLLPSASLALSWPVWLAKLSAATVSIKVITAGATSTGASLTALMLTLKVLLPTPGGVAPSEALTVKVSLVLALRALMAVALGT